VEIAAKRAADQVALRGVLLGCALLERAAELRV